MSVKHTPTPWVVGDDGINWSGILTLQGLPIAGHLLLIDAEFIVRAVNSHEALVSALEAISQFIMNPTDANRILLSIRGAMAIKAIDQAKAQP